MDTEWVPDVSIGDRLRIVRRRRHRTQDEMADALGVKTSTYSAWESGRNTPSLKEVQDIARRLYMLDRVPQWWTLGADVPSVHPENRAQTGGRGPGSVTDAFGARSSTDRASDYGSDLGRFSPFQMPTRRRVDRRRQMGVIPLRLVTDGEAASA